MLVKHGAQSALAHTLYKMKVRRARLLLWVSDLTVVISCCSYLWILAVNSPLLYQLMC
jgi:hypothetical protein